jgi:hypothetical protein
MTIAMKMTMMMMNWETAFGLPARPLLHLKGLAYNIKQDSYSAAVHPDFIIHNVNGYVIKGAILMNHGLSLASIDIS